MSSYDKFAYDLSSKAFRFESIPGSIASKSLTFTGAANLGAIGTVPLFTVTGDVLLTIVGLCTTTLVGATATLSVGVAGATTSLIPSFTATNLTAGKAVDSTGIISAGTAPKTAPVFNESSFNIIGTVGTAAITAGVVNWYCFWMALSSGASVA